MSDHPRYVEFCERCGDNAVAEMMESIADALWNHTSTADLTIEDVHQHNACNHTITGEVNHAGERFRFIVEMGDIVGCLVIDWGSVDEVGFYEPPKPTIYQLTPLDPSLEYERPEMFKVYLEWRKYKWFQEMEKGYNYDRHFHPGGYIEGKYREKAAKRGLEFQPSEEVESRIQRFLALSLEAEAYR